MGQNAILTALQLTARANQMRAIMMLAFALVALHSAEEGAAHRHGMESVLYNASHYLGNGVEGGILKTLRHLIP
jgi:hypothetical protein